MLIIKVFANSAKFIAQLGRGVQMLGETFTLLRPVYYLITIFLLCNLAYIIFLKNKIKATTYVLVNSFFLVVIGGVLLIQQGIIVDEFNKSGDSVIFDLTICFVIIFLISLIFKSKNENK